MSHRRWRPGIRLGIALPLLLTIGWVIGCGDGDSPIVDPGPAPPANQAPETTGAIPAQSLHVGTNVTVDLSQYFSDADDDALTYSATSSDTLVAEAGVSDHRLILVAVSRGAAAAAITASDGRGGEARQSFPVTVLNAPPRAVGEIASRTLGPGSTTAIDLSEYFSDSDGDALTYRAASSDTLVARVSVSGHELTLVAVSRGTVSATITATDGSGGEARHSFSVSVLNSPPIPATEIASRTLATGSTRTIDLSGYFSDADGDALTYSAASSDARVAEVSVSGSELAMVGVSPGVAEATVTARDHEEVEARQSFELTVCAVPQGILHWWSAEGSGADRVGGADATLMGGATYGQGIAGNSGGEAFAFDGVDAIALVPDAPTLNPKGPFTVMAWARTGPVPRPNGTIVGKGHPWAESWVLDPHRDRWRAVIRRENGSSTSAYGSAIEPMAWTHVAMSWDGRVLALYVDGQRVETALVNSISVSDGPAGIGARSEQGFADDELELEFEGEIDEVMFFGRALGEEEIQSVFDKATLGFCDL